MSWSLTFPTTATKRGYSRTDTASLDLAGTFTIMWWGDRIASTLNNKVVVAKQDSTHGIAYMVQYANNDGHHIKLSIHNGTNEMVTTWTSPSATGAGDFNHWAITFNGSLGAGVKSILYRNSVSQGNGTVTGTEVTTAKNGDGIFVIGRQVDGREGTTESLENLNLFCVEVYNAVLSQATIAARYLVRRVGNETNLVGCWLQGGAKERSELEGTASTTTGNYRLWDRTANANHLTQNFGAALETELPYIGTDQPRTGIFPFTQLWSGVGELRDLGEYYIEGAMYSSNPFFDQLYEAEAYVEGSLYSSEPLFDTLADAEAYVESSPYSSEPGFDQYYDANIESLSFTVYSGTVETQTDDAEEYKLGITIVPEDPNVAPTITNVAPSPGLLGSAQPIVFDVDDLDPGLRLVLVTLQYGPPHNKLTYLVHDGSNFRPPFTANSTRTSTANGYHYSIVHDGGWLASIEQIFVYAVDQEGLMEGVLP